jgi:hypothetical protein
MHSQKQQPVSCQRMERPGSINQGFAVTARLYACIKTGGFPFYRQHQPL